MIRLNDTIKRLIPWTGLSQATIAEQVGISTAQLSQYLNGNASANKDVLEKLMQLVGLKHQNYSNRVDLVYKVVKIIHEKEIPIKSVVYYSKEKMAEVTSIKEIEQFIDVSHQQLESIIKNGIVDYECTYPYFKAMVIIAMGMRDKISNKAFTVSVFDTLRNIMPPASSMVLSKPLGKILGLTAGVTAPALTTAFILGNLINNTISSFTDNKYKNLSGLKNVSALQLALQLTCISEDKHAKAGNAEI